MLVRILIKQTSCFQDFSGTPSSLHLKPGSHHEEKGVVIISYESVPPAAKGYPVLQLNTHYPPLLAWAFGVALKRVFCKLASVLKVNLHYFFSLGGAESCRGSLQSSVKSCRRQVEGSGDASQELLPEGRI